MRSTCVATWCAAAMACALSLFGGCQSNSQRDLIARERRRQEDQIYALQDYIDQYQRLVCAYRTENAALRRQLVAMPRDSRGQDEESSRLHRGSKEEFPAPQFQQPQVPTPEKVKPADTPASPPKAIETPEIPPLKTMSWEEPDATADAEAVLDSMPDSLPQERNEAGRAIQQATFAVEPVESVSNQFSEGAAPGPLQEPAQHSSQDLAEDTAQVPTEVVAPTATTGQTELMISGEVIENGAGGPRLVVDVVPYLPSGKVETFEGVASLMILATGEDGIERSLARWDFSARQVRAAIDPQSNEPTMRFLLELPTDAPVTNDTELWVRLVPASGSKLLSHADVVLSQAGSFASATERMWPAEESVVAASYEEGYQPELEAEANGPESQSLSGIAESLPLPVGPISMEESQWATALPGKPVLVASATKGDFDQSGWRVSTQPMPPGPAPNAAVTATLSGKESPRVRKLQKLAKPDNQAAPAGWSAEREGIGRPHTATLPRWAATR
ncbi:MAG: hypothetical protein IT425_08380 [Pirellulales bacterium]|nr:hypothetical protein [Pirellulales bacterium]